MFVGDSVGVFKLKKVFVVVVSGVGVVFEAGVVLGAGSGVGVGAGVAGDQRLGVRSLLLASQPSLDAIGVEPAFPVPPPGLFRSVRLEVVLLLTVVGCVFGGGIEMFVVGVVRCFSTLLWVLQMKVPGSFPAL